MSAYNVLAPHSEKMKDGKDAPPDYIVTNVYEKTGDRWLIVSHHVQPKPQ
jgi:ketosteroid isomerase-like protein